MKTSTPKFRFLEVGISIKGSEFYLVFAVPYSLVMRRVKAGDSIRSLSVEDWLSLDFPTLLAYRLNIATSFVLCHYIKPFYPNSDLQVSIYHANSLPASWADPFISLIAQSYANKIVTK